MSTSPFGPSDPKDLDNLPEWARVTADFSGQEESLLPSNTPEKPQKPRRGLSRPKTGKPSKKKVETVTKESNGAVARFLRKWRGGRWVVLAVRVGIAFVVILFSALGIMRVVNPVPINEEDIVTELEQRLEIVEFPTQAGDRLAQEYVREFFTWQEGEVNDNLLALLPINADYQFRPSVGSDVVSISVLQGPYLQDRPEYVSDTSAVFTYRVEVRTITLIDDEKTPGEQIEQASTKWWTVSVPLIVQDGRTTIAAPPSLMPALDAGPTPDLVRLDVDEESSKAAQEYLEIYFQQWAAANENEPVASAYLLSGRSTADARYGLDGLVELVRIDSVQIPVEVLEEGAISTGERTADVFIIWRDTATGVELSASYRMDLLLRDNYWYVLDIKGGSFSAPE